MKPSFEKLAMSEDALMRGDICMGNSEEEVVVISYGRGVGR